MLDKKALSREIQDALETVDPKSKNLSEDTWNAVSAAIVKNLKNTVEVDKDFLPHTHPELQSSGYGQGIIEQGTNSNGTYTKFGDGTMECFGAVTPASNNNSGTQYDFPYAFTSVKSFIAQANAIASGVTSSSYVTESSVVSLTAFKVKVLLHAATTISDATGVSISWTAIGRWKA